MYLLFVSCDRPPGRVLIDVTQIIEINDPYGPTLTGPTFNAIIVSEETQKVGRPKRGGSNSCVVANRELVRRGQRTSTRSGRPTVCSHWR